MKYLCLIYEDETFWSKTPKQELDAIMGDYHAFSATYKQSGHVLGGNALEPTATATTIRSDIVTDGPFVETKEALGGYYLIEATDLDQALAVAKLCPAPYGGVEVRPIMTF